MAGSIKRSVTVAYKAVYNQATAAMRRLTTSQREMSKEIQGSNRKSATSWKGVAAGVLGVVAAMKALGAASAFVGSSVTEATRLEKSMAEVFTITDLTTEGQREYSAEVRRFSREYGKDATEVAKALYQTISAGVSDASDAQLVMSESLRFSIAALTEASEAVDVITTTLNAYGFEASEAARVSDVLFTTIRLGKTTGQELAGALGRVIPIAATAGVEFEDLTSAIVLMTRAGLSTDEAVTSLRQLLLSIAAPTSQAKEAIDELGLSLFNESTLRERGGIFEVLRELNELDETSIETLEGVIPNVRALVGALALLGQDSGIDEVASQMREAGAAGDALSIQMDTWDARFTKFGNNWSLLKEAVGAGILTVIGEERFDTLLEAFDGFLERIESARAAYNKLIDDGASRSEAFAVVADMLSDAWSETFGVVLPELLDGFSDDVSAALKNIIPVVVQWGGEFVTQVTPSLIRAGSILGESLADSLIATARSKLAESGLFGIGGVLLNEFLNSGDGGENGYQHGGAVNGYQMGGAVAGSPGVDTINARVTEGEYIIRREIVQALGQQFFDAVNSSGPAVMNLNLPNVTTAAQATAIAPRLASGFARYQSVGGLR